MSASHYSVVVSKPTVRVVLSLALTAVLVAFFLWNVNVARVMGVLREARIGWLALSVGLVLLAYWVRAARWALILRPVARVRHSSVVLVSAVGYAAMALLPARMGDIIRPVLLARRERFPISASLPSILIERVFDISTVLLFFLIFIAWPPAMSSGEPARHSLRLVTIGGYVVGAGVIVGTLVLLALLRYRKSFVELLTAALGRVRPSWRAPAASLLNHFVDGLRVLQRPRDLLSAVASSLFLWIILFWQLHVLLKAFSVTLSLRASFLLVTLSLVGLAIPTPGGIGGFHKAIQIGLTLFFGVELNHATGIAIAYHAVCFLPITAIGLLCLPMLGLSLREVEAMTGNGADAGADSVATHSAVTPGDAEQGDSHGSI